MRELSKLALTFIVALSGVGVFHWLSLPLPFLMGPIFACLLFAVCGGPLKVIGVLNNGMRTVLGVAVGATLTPVVLLSMTGMWQTLIMIPAVVFCIGIVGVPYFRFVCGYNFATSYFAAMPGGLQDMLAFGEEAGANVRALSLIHATRVLFVVVLLPLLLVHYWQVNLQNAPGKAIQDTPTLQLLLMLACALIGWRLAKRVGLFGASILGPLIAAALLSGFGVLTHRPPAEAIWLAQFFIGITVGANYAGITMSEIKQDVMAGIGFCVYLMMLTLFMLVIIRYLNLADMKDALLAFSPGGQAELTVLALITGADIGFVVAHHIVRLVSVIVGAPLCLQWLKARN